MTFRWALFLKKGIGMSELLQEYVDSGSERLRVDRQMGVIRGVKLLGIESRNGRRYRESALAEAVGLYEGSKVNVNHPKGHPLSPRDYQDRLGVIRAVEFRPGQGLFGDLHCNPKHALSEQLIWDAEHAPQNVGMSHNVLARTSRDDSGTVVDAITKVQSIDLVADPATTQGLFEHTEAATAEGEAGDEDGQPSWAALTLEGLRLHRADLVEQIESAIAAQLEDARSRLDEMVAREAAARRRQRVVELLQEHSLPLPDAAAEAARQITSHEFVERLMNAADDDAVRRLVEQRAALVRSAHDWNGEPAARDRRPKCRDQFALACRGTGRRIASAREFAAAVSGA
jgi:hypothetical protein